VRLLALLVLSLLTPRPAAAQESAAFLKIGVGARATGMGGAATAVADDATAIYWNPAGLSGLTRRSVDATQADLFANTRYDFLGYAQPTPYGTLGAAAQYLSQGALSGRSVSGAPTGNYGASDAAADVSYAAKIPALPGLGLGGTAKYIRSGIADVSAQSFALDAGARYVPPGSGADGASFGLAVQNMGPGLKFLAQTAPLPLTVAAGAAYRLPFGLLLALDYKYRPYDHPGELSVGAECLLVSTFALRAGYDSDTVSSEGETGFAALSGFTAGFGLKVRGFVVDYSMAPMGQLGNVQQLSLGAGF
jgi:hypothetical protein